MCCSSSQLTVIITASFIRSHPSIRIIKKTINSLKKINISGCKIILAHDYSNHPLYLSYIAYLKEYIKIEGLSNIVIIIRQSHGHLVGNIRNALKFVKTEWILVLQHDLPFIRQLDIKKVIEDMSNNPKLKHVKFPYVKLTKPPSYPYDSKDWDNKNRLYGQQIYEKNYTYTRTPCWSDYNHICRKKYYTNIVLKKCNDGVPMEEVLNPLCTEEMHDFYGTYFFGALNDKPYLYNLDGRDSLRVYPISRVYSFIKSIERRFRRLIKHNK